MTICDMTHPHKHDMQVAGLDLTNGFKVKRVNLHTFMFMFVTDGIVISLLLKVNIYKVFTFVGT